MSARNTLCSRFFVLLVAMLLAACSDRAGPGESLVAETGQQASISLDVYKSPSCGCCVDWIEHLESNGISVHVHHPKDMDALKAGNNIRPRYRSCHTAISADGSIFEGHVPAKLIVEFLREPPANAIGLAVPGMPLGSPGMEMGGKFTPYDVLLLKADGASEISAHMSSSQEQY